MTAKIIVACGSGVATSQTVASKLARMLKEAKIDAEVNAVDLKSVDRHLADAAAYVTIVREAKERDIPMINGISFLTGVGQDTEFAKLVEAIKASEQG